MKEPIIETMSITVVDPEDEDNYINLDATYVGEEEKNWTIEGKCDSLDMLQNLVSKLYQYVGTIKK